MLCESDSSEAVDVLSDESEDVLSCALYCDCDLTIIAWTRVNTSTSRARLLTKSMHSSVSLLLG